jgi:ankyrin repeat protein
MYTSNLSDDGRLVADEEDLVYRPLSFENDLFTARVYKRNYQWPVIQKVSHFIRRPSSEAMAHKTATRNDSKDSLVGAESMISQGQDTLNGEIISVDVGSTEEHAVGQTDINDRESSDSVPSDSEYLMPSMCYIFSGQGDHKTVEHFSEDGHDVHAQNAMFREPDESMSAMQRNVELGGNLMRDGVDTEHASFPHGIQPIHRAAACGSINIIKILLHHGAAIDSIDVDGRQPLHYASQSQCCDGPDVIEFLCSHGADVDANCSKGLVSSPVHFASAQNRVENLKALLALGAKIDDDHCGSVVSALNIAMRFRAFATASLLLEHRADPNRRDEIGRLAFHALFAEYHGEGLIDNPSLYNRVPMLDLLTKHGSELDTQDSEGNTPLHYLVRHRPLSIEESQAQLELAKKILDWVDSTDTVDHDGLTALYFSLTTPEQEQTSLLLIEVGARVLIGKADYQLALHVEQIAGSAVLSCSLRHSRGSTTEIWEIGMYSQPQHHMALPCHKDSADREDFPGAFGKDSIRAIGTVLTEALHIVL